MHVGLGSREPGEREEKKKLTSPWEREQVVLGTKHAFTFDCVYGGNGRDQDELFQECILPLVEGVVQGYNGTVRTRR